MLLRKEANRLQIGLNRWRDIGFIHRFCRMVADAAVVTHEQHPHRPALSNGNSIMTRPAGQRQAASLIGFYRVAQRLLQSGIAGRCRDTVILLRAKG